MLLNNNVSIELAKSIDTLKYITAFSARTTNKFHNVVQLRHKINHMFSEIKYFLSLTQGLSAGIHPSSM